MKRSELLDLFIKEIKDDKWNIYVLFKNFYFKLVAEGKIKESERFTAHNLRNELIERGWIAEK